MLRVLRHIQVDPTFSFVFTEASQERAESSSYVSGVAVRFDNINARRTIAPTGRNKNAPTEIERTSTIHKRAEEFIPSCANLNNSSLT